MERRELFKIIGAGAVAAPAHAQHQHASAPVATYKPRALSTAQYEKLGVLLEALLPADATSPSAKDAGVAMYIDTVLKHGDQAMRDIWTSGLNAISADELTKLAAGEMQPATEAERFFVIFKQAAINAYYLSDAGRRSLGYKGDTAIPEFRGCTHPEHQKL